MLDKSSKIYVAGHHGLVGSAIWNNLKRRGYCNLVGRTHSELDLTDQLAVKRFFDEEQPDAEHEDSVQRHRASIQAPCEEASLPWFYLHISQKRPAANEGGRPADISIGVYQ